MTSVIGGMDLSHEFRQMALAMFVAYKAFLMNETPVACIVVDKDSQKILSIGYNYTNISLNGTKHAEFIAMKRLVDEGYDMSKVVMYVTVEPCIMCASFLRQLGISEVYFGCGNDRFGGNGTVLSIHKDSHLPCSNYKSYGGIMRTEGIHLLRNFYIQENDSAPIPQVKKNKDIDKKAFPENNIVISKDEFISRYGIERLNAFEDKTIELTPITKQGYHIGDLISIDDVNAIPYIEEEMGEISTEQFQNFISLFSRIGEDGKVDFDEPSTKKRHLMVE